MNDQNAQILNDDYEHLGPKMRARLDSAEINFGRLREYLDLLADRSRKANEIARELSLLLGFGIYPNWDEIKRRRAR